MGAIQEFVGGEGLPQQKVAPEGEIRRRPYTVLVGFGIEVQSEINQ